MDSTQCKKDPPSQGPQGQTGPQGLCRDFKMVSRVGGAWLRLLTCVTWNSCKNTNPWALLGRPQVSRTLKDPESISSQEPGRAESLCGGFGTPGSSLPNRTRQVDASLCQAGECLTFSHTHAHASAHMHTHEQAHIKHRT